jgi:pimeloyl-ACP methyl ester carboxylesterase
MQPQLHYDVHGEAGPHVLLVHGMLSSRAQWMLNLDALIGAGFRPVVTELLGHGRSPTPEDPDAYTPTSYIRYFEEIREAVGAGRWYVIGQSLGAGLTLRYSLVHPGRVIAQAFTNSNSALAGPELFARLRASAGRMIEEVTRRGRAVMEDNRLNPARSRSIPEHVRAALAEDFALHTPLGYALTSAHTTANVSVRDEVGANAVPTLLVAGMREESFRPVVAWARANIPHLEVAETPAGHAVNIQAAEAFNEAVISFFRRHRPD